MPGLSRPPQPPFIDGGRTHRQADRYEGGVRGSKLTLLLEVSLAALVRLRGRRLDDARADREPASGDAGARFAGRVAPIRPASTRCSGESTRSSALCTFLGTRMGDSLAHMWAAVLAGFHKRGYTMRPWNARRRQNEREEREGGDGIRPPAL